MRKNPIALWCALTFAILPGCGGGDDGGGGNPPDARQSPDAGQSPDAAPAPDGSTVGPVDMTGAIQKGPFIIGSNVVVAMLDPATANPTGDDFSTLTRNDLGEFDVTLPGTGAAEIQTTGFYFNEVLNTPSAAPITMRALAFFPFSGPSEVHVNALTHLGHLRAKKLVGDGMGFEEAIAQAESELRAALPLARTLEVAAGTELDILGGDSDANAYLFALSCVLGQTALNEGGGSVDAELQEQMTTIALDLEDDGVLTPALVDTLGRGARLLEGDRCTANMEAFVASKGSSATIPDIRRALDFDGDGTGDRADTDADGDGRPADMDAIVQIISGYGRGNGLALDQGGTLWTWSSSPQFGVTECLSGLACPALPFTALAELGTARDLALSGEGGGDYAVLLTDGRIAAWGMFFGYTPRLVASAEDIIWLRGAGLTRRGVFFAIRDDNTLWEIESQSTTQITAITQARAVSNLDDERAPLWVLRTDGTIQGHDSNFTETYAVNGVTDAVDLAASLSSNYGYAVDGDGGLWRWSPQDAVDDGSATATQVSLSAPVVSLTPDGFLAVLEDGSVWRLGQPSAPSVVPGLSDVARVSGGAALLRDGTVVTFDVGFGSPANPQPVYIPR